jgi:hypothetical protein
MTVVLGLVLRSSIHVCRRPPLIRRCRPGRAERDNGPTGRGRSRVWQFGGGVVRVTAGHPGSQTGVRELAGTSAGKLLEDAGSDKVHEGGDGVAGEPGDFGDGHRGASRLAAGGAAGDPAGVDRGSGDEGGAVGVGFEIDLEGVCNNNGVTTSGRLGRWPGRNGR